MYPLTKRLFDIAASFLGLLAISPLLAAISVLIKLDSKGPVFYKGVRSGKDSRPFEMFKFRTMVLDADKIGGSSTPEDDPRVTGIGRILRNYKLDELPQLINVLKGDMSFVGPRPQIPWVVELYTPEEREALTVRPGITDYASLRFSNEGEILKGSLDPDKDYMEKIHPEKMRLAVEYVRTMSFLVDMRILLQTVKAVLK